MKWEYIVATIFFSTIGYIIGSISSAVILSKKRRKEDVRTRGSGNAGATNTLRNYGKKLGLTVFIIDVSKTIIAVLIAWLSNKYSTVSWFKGALLPVVGLSVIAGHVWPIFFKFKGGKGAACAVGFFISMQWILAIIGFITFIIIVKKTKKVSLGSIIVPGLLLILQIIFLATNNFLSDQWSMPLMYKEQWWICVIATSCVWLIIVYKHKANIKRLINGNENTI